MPASRERQKLLAPERAEAVARDAALAIRNAIAREDFAALAAYVNGRVCLEASKGGSCRWMSETELRACKTAPGREEWQVDTGADELPRLTCRQAFRDVFFAHPGLRNAEPAFNRFLPRPDNNASSIFSPEVPGDIYVELFADEAEVGGQWYPWRSLWLVFEARGDTARLVAIQSHYWGI